MLNKLKTSKSCSFLLSTTLILGIYFFKRYYYAKSKNRLKIASFLNNLFMKYDNERLHNSKASLFSSLNRQLLLLNNNNDNFVSIFEIGCGCGSNINYYPSGMCY